MKAKFLKTVLFVFLCAQFSCLLAETAVSGVRSSAATSVKAGKKRTLQRDVRTAQSIVNRPTYSMTCPKASSLELRLFYTMTSWGVRPWKIQPNRFIRAYARIDPDNLKKVTLACHYEVTLDYTATHHYNGLQECIANPATNKGKIGYRAPSGYTSNIVGTSAPGMLDVLKTGERVNGDVLECFYHLEDEAQLYKKHDSNINLENCKTKERLVVCS